MSKAEEKALEAYPKETRDITGFVVDIGHPQYMRDLYIEGYQQAEKDVAEAFARIIRGNLGGIGNGIQNMFEQLYTDITGEKMYKGFKD